MKVHKFIRYPEEVVEVTHLVRAGAGGEVNEAKLRKTGGCPAKQEGVWEELKGGLGKHIGGG